MYKSELICQVMDACIKHQEVASVDFGTEFDINIVGDKLYPHVFVESEVSQLGTGSNIDEHNLALLFLTRYKEGDKTDELQNQVVAERIMKQCVEYIDEFVDGIGIEKPYSAISLHEFDSDVLTGWRAELNFIVNPTLNRCDLKSIFNAVEVLPGEFQCTVPIKLPPKPTQSMNVSEFVNVTSQSYFTISSDTLAYGGTDIFTPIVGALINIWMANDSGTGSIRVIDKTNADNIIFEKTDIADTDINAPVFVDIFSNQPALPARFAIEIKCNGAGNTIRYRSLAMY